MDLSFVSQKVVWINSCRRRLAAGGLPEFWPWRRTAATPLLGAATFAIFGQRPDLGEG